MSVQDNVFFKAFAFVLGALVIFTVSIMLLANIISAPAQTAVDPLVQSRLLERIQPVGMSRIEP